MERRFQKSLDRQRRKLDREGEKDDNRSNSSRDKATYSPKNKDERLHRLCRFPRLFMGIFIARGGDCLQILRFLLLLSLSLRRLLVVVVVVVIHWALRRRLASVQQPMLVLSH